MGKKLIYIKIAKVYRTMANEALCMLTVLTPIDIKIEETCKFYQLNKCSSKVEALLDDMKVRYWHQPQKR